MKPVSSNNQPETLTMNAMIQTEVLSDGSAVHNVLIPREINEPDVLIGAESYEAAVAIRDAINNGAVWVQA